MRSGVWIRMSCELCSPIHFLSTTTKLVVTDSEIGGYQTKPLQMDNTNSSPPILGNSDLPFILSKNAIFRSLNSVPTPAEASYTRNLLTSAESELHQLYFDIAILLAKRTQITKQITNCKTILSPHKSLPAELISKIFSFTITEPYATIPLEYGKQNVRLQITQVCSRWRRIAFDTPDLWNFVFSFSCTKSYADLVTFWWSQNSSSKFKISDMYWAEGGATSNFNFFDKFILPFSERLREIRTSAFDAVREKILSASPEVFRNLEAVTFWIDPRTLARLSEEGMTLMTAPKLRSVSLNVVSESWFCPTFPWAQITRLTLTARIPPDACFILLAKCVSLVHCDLSYIEEGFAPVTELGPLPDFPLHLPLLKFFSVCFQPGNFSSLLSHLHLPNLSEFRITLDVIHREDHWTRDCRVFFQSARESLRHVEIRSSVRNNRPANLLDGGILFNFPNITSFIASHYYPLRSSTLDQIARGQLLPKIEFLKFYTNNAADVVNLLTARGRNASSPSSGAVSPIKEIQVDYKKMSYRDSEELSAFRSEGVLTGYDVRFDNLMMSWDSDDWDSD